MNTTLIEKKITLEPKYLDSNIMTHLLDAVRRATHTDCAKEYGYVMDITELVDIISSEDNIFNLRVKARTLKVDVGDEVVGKVCMLYKDGIFAIVDGKQRVLIPATSLCDFEYLETSNTFTHKSGDIVIHNGDIVHIRVVHTMYNRKNLSCVGSLIT